MIDSLSWFLEASFEVNVEGVREDAADVHDEVFHACEEEEKVVEPADSLHDESGDFEEVKDGVDSGVLGFLSKWAAT